MSKQKKQMERARKRWQVVAAKKNNSALKSGNAYILKLVYCLSRISSIFIFY